MFTDYIRTSLLAQRCIINLIAKGRYGPNLFPAYGCLTRRDIDIVFIHGFNGSAFFTWRQLGDLHKRDDLQNFTFCWPKDWLSKDLNARAKIILVDYNSGWSFDEIEEAIGEQLIKAGIGKAPLVLVGHSMGGIIVKRLICDRPAIANAIRGIIFFSVPHLGVDHIVPKSLVSPSNLKKLSNSNPYLAQLHNRFVNTILSRPIRILNICELLPMNGLAGRIMGPEPVVSVSDADIGIGRLITTGKTHIEVCKLENRKCFDYGEIIDFVNLIIVDNVNNNRKPKYNWFYDDYLCPF